MKNNKKVLSIPNMRVLNIVNDIKELNDRTKRLLDEWDKIKDFPYSASHKFILEEMESLSNQ